MRQQVSADCDLSGDVTFFTTFTLPWNNQRRDTLTLDPEDFAANRESEKPSSNSQPSAPETSPAHATVELSTECLRNRLSARDCRWARRKTAPSVRSCCKDEDESARANGSAQSGECLEDAAAHGGVDEREPHLDRLHVLHLGPQLRVHLHLTPPTRPLSSRRPDPTVSLHEAARSLQVEKEDCEGLERNYAK